MEFNKLLKLFFLGLVISFVGLYYMGSTGYYENVERRKMNLTEEQIKKFEQDVAEGKEINIKNYLEETEKDYSNSISTTTASLSKTIGKLFDKTIKALVKTINDTVE